MGLKTFSEKINSRGEFMSYNLGKNTVLLEYREQEFSDKSVSDNTFMTDNV